MAAILALAFVQQADAQQPVAALVARVAANENAVRSYTADAQANVSLKTFPYLSASPAGQFYHKDGRNKLVFTSGVPFVAQQFSKLYPDFPPAQQWQDVYAIAPENQGGGYTTLKLVPRKHGRIDYIDAKIKESTGEVVSLKFNYDDGGYASMGQTYSTVRGHRMISGNSGHFQEPNYSADWTMTFANFKLNVNIPDSVFDQ
jgi:hypothetical protein